VLASALPAAAQSPAAKLSAPVPAPTIRGSSPDPFQDGPRMPAARLGPVSGARIGEGPDNASDEERYNWGAPRERRAIPTSRSRERESNRDRDDDRDRDDRYDRRGATLREPAPGRGTHGRRGGPPPLGYEEPPPPPPPGGGPAWWPNREQDLADLRDRFPAFGDTGGGGDRLAFQSDCAFDGFSSPITNPFLAEDPRSLTELRPIYIYQTMPSNHYFFQGGNIQFFGGQFRAAFTERFSVVLHKLGGMTINPEGPLGGGSGFTEIWLGPKFAFWRVPDTQTIASFGLQFQLPVGSGSIYQNTGNFGLVPYLSVGTELGRTDYGTFRLINVAGYHLGTDDGRSNYLYDSLHIDLDAGDYHRFYPTLELNWFYYTSDGQDRPFLLFEGRDLANVGATASGKSYFSIAPGFRYRFTDYLQMGLAAEFGLGGSNDLLRFRLGVDLIWRY
jgi:hypothetical protein